MNEPITRRMRYLAAPAPPREDAIPLDLPAKCEDNMVGLAAKLASMTPKPSQSITSCEQVKGLGFCSSKEPGEKALAHQFCMKTCEVCHGNLVPFAGKLCTVGLVRSAVCPLTRADLARMCFVVRRHAPSLR
jgi:hypothetical protein